jgi:hypothetical protein
MSWAVEAGFEYPATDLLWFLAMATSDTVLHQEMSDGAHRVEHHWSY